MVDLLIKLAVAGLVFFAVLNLAGLHTWVERKQSALIQDRIGANRASIFGFRFLGILLVIASPAVTKTRKATGCTTMPQKGIQPPIMCPWFRTSSDKSMVP